MQYHYHVPGGTSDQGVTQTAVPAQQQWGWGPAAHLLRPEQTRGSPWGFLQLSQATSSRASREAPAWHPEPVATAPVFPASRCAQDPSFPAVGRSIHPQPQHPSWGFLLDSVQVLPPVQPVSQAGGQSCGVLTSPRLPKAPGEVCTCPRVYFCLSGHRSVPGAQGLFFAASSD